LKVIVEKGTKNETSVKLVKCEDGRELGLCYSAGDLPETTEIDDVSRKEFNDMCTKHCGECLVSGRKYYEIKVVPGADSFAYDVSGDIIPVEVTVLSAQYSSATDKEVQQFNSVPKEDEDVFAFSNDYHCGEKIQFKVSPVHEGYNHGDVDDFGAVELSMVECRMSMVPGETGRLDDDDIVVIGGDIQVTFHCQNPPTSAPSISLPTLSPSQNPTSSPKPTITPPTVSPSQQPECQDHEGLVFTHEDQDADITCDHLIDISDCDTQAGAMMAFLEFGLGAGLTLGSGITRDMYIIDICPNAFKDKCTTCASVFSRPSLDGDWQQWLGIHSTKEDCATAVVAQCSNKNAFLYADNGGDLNCGCVYDGRTIWSPGAAGNPTVTFYRVVEAMLDDSPPPIGKGSIQCGSRFTDSVSEPKETHRYEFTASTTALTFDSCGTGELDTILRILDANEVELFINDDHDGRCPGNYASSHIDATGFEVGATYFLEVAAFGTNIGEYEIFLECVGCKDFEGSFLELKDQGHNDVFISYTCELLRDQGADENGCVSKVGDFAKLFPGSYITDERISEDMTASDICPQLYKDICDTCATENRL